VVTIVEVTKTKSDQIAWIPLLPSREVHIRYRLRGVDLCGSGRL
jgi:hypothetical protein